MTETAREKHSSTSETIFHIEKGFNERPLPYSSKKDTGETANCPCDGCEHFIHCKQEKEACERFSKWQIGKKKELHKFSREPCKKYYNKILA